MDQNKNDKRVELNDDVLKALRDAILHHEKLYQDRIFMNPRTYDRLVGHGIEIPDDRITRSELVPENKAYGIPKTMLEPKWPHEYEPVSMWAMGENRLKWDSFMYRGSTMPRAKPRINDWMANPNFSAEWDYWRYREDYKQFRLYRFTVWLFHSHWFPPLRQRFSRILGYTHSHKEL